MTGNCPKCDKPVQRMTLTGATASTGLGGTDWRAITFNCPHCSAILGAQIDPVAIKTSIIDALKKR